MLLRSSLWIVLFMSSEALLIFCPLVLLLINRAVLKSLAIILGFSVISFNCNQVFALIMLKLCYQVHTHLGLLCSRDKLTLLSLRHASLFMVIFFGVKSTLSSINIITPALFHCLHGTSYFNPFIFILFMTKVAFCRQNTVGFFKINNLTDYLQLQCLDHLPLI